MKLIDILVQELPKLGGWPVSALSIAQDSEGHAWGYNCEHLTLQPHGWWKSRSGDAICTDGIKLYQMASDWNSTFVTREQYEAALEASEGWIEWDGGKCPVDEGVMIDVRYRDMKVKTLPANERIDGREATNPYWRHDNQINDIIAYRLHKPDIDSRANDDRLEQDLNECIGASEAQVWKGESLPPVGTKCIFSYEGPDWCWGDKLKNGDEVDIIAHFSARDDSQYCMVAAFTNKNNHHVQVYQAISGCFRPLRTEAENAREAAIQDLTSVICGNVPDTGMATAAMYAERVYDAGYRKEVK